ncbi:hypothetical protein P171DRAFT_511622 [Karstenula rhodostoma CBS 690.94]|uniref:Uncharacterized protein n=1 Tax=Karstenula rhodostoma CBS 690.94 TaxID=1392251 RepID=A0A9P4PNP6_9PLEO|nr:hypothetical protein P171DRAFT_511622 [Karstenula rhodostoma CBS 690.94]
MGPFIQRSTQWLMYSTWNTEWINVLLGVISLSSDGEMWCEKDLVVAAPANSDTQNYGEGPCWFPYRLTFIMGRDRRTDGFGRLPSCRILVAPGKRMFDGWILLQPDVARLSEINWGFGTTRHPVVPLKPEGTSYPSSEGATARFNNINGAEKSLSSPLLSILNFFSILAL